MFERYTEQARRVIFFARYEASQFGSELMEPEHFLLGLFREAPSLMSRVLPGVTGEMVRTQIERETALRPRVSTSIDLPLSHALKRVLAFGAEESERMNHRHIGTEHHLLGLLREPSIASRILESYGVTLESARQLIAKSGVAAEPFGAGSASLQEGHFSSSSMENGTVTFKTRRVHKGHKITLIEKLRVSDDGKTLHYSQELRGPKGERSWSMDFDLT
jgi:ATP-dependent Clp protease ATP-binding subunit ClpC